MQTAESHRYPKHLAFRVPACLGAAVEEAARLHLTSASEYLRQAVRRALVADGVHIGVRGRVENEPGGTASGRQPAVNPEYLSDGHGRPRPGNRPYARSED